MAALIVTDAAIHMAATKYAVDPDLLAAICHVESDRNPWAMRYEPQYPYIVGDHLSATELIGQKTSYGCTQVMGAVARELGFSGKYLSELCDPAIGLEYGAAHLANHFMRWKSWEAAVSAYNQGSPRRRPTGEFINQEYVDKVTTEWKRLKALRPVSGGGN